MFTKMDTEALVFGADEDGADDVAGAELIVSIKGNEGLWKTYMKRRRNPSWRRGCRRVSKIERRIRPAVPAMAKTTEGLGVSTSTLKRLRDYVAYLQMQRGLSPT